MKKTILFLLALALAVAGPRLAAAAPFLTADPYPANADANLNIVSFVLTGIASNPVTVQAQIGTSGQQYLFYDLGPLSNATYTVTAAAVNGYALESAQSPPFLFNKGIPSIPANIKVVPSLPVPLP